MYNKKKTKPGVMLVVCYQMFYKDDFFFLIETGRIITYNLYNTPGSVFLKDN